MLFFVLVLFKCYSDMSNYPTTIDIALVGHCLCETVKRCISVLLSRCLGVLVLLCMGVTVCWCYCVWV